MNNKENKKASDYVYFRNSEETVFRSDETQKAEVTKKIKQKRRKKIILNRFR